MKQELKSKKKVDVFAVSCMCGTYLSTSLSATVNSEKQLFLKVICIFYGKEGSPTRVLRGSLGGGKMGGKLKRGSYFSEGLFAI